MSIIKFYRSCFLRVLLSFLVILGGVSLHGQIDYSEKTSDKELRVALNEFIKYAHPLVESGLRLQEELSESEKKKLLISKINISSALNLSLFHEQPIYALLDTWILLYQIKDCAAREINLEFEENIDELIFRLSDIFKYQAESLSFNKSRDFVQGYASSHPISCQEIYRDSPLSKIEMLLEKEKEGVIAKINTITDQLDVLNFKMNYWMEYLPKQMKWQMELLTYDFFDRKFQDSLSLTDVMFSINNLANETDNLLGKIPAMSDTFNFEMNKTLDLQMQSVHRMMETERRAFLFGLGQERAIAMDSLLNHFESWKTLIEVVQSNSMEDADQLSNKFISATSTEIERLTNRITLLVILFCATILLAVGLLRWNRN